MSLVKLEWARRSVSEKLLKGSFIIQQMTANADVYVAPNPALADVQLALDALTDAATAAEAGGVALTLAKNDAEATFDGLINQLASYVQNVSAGNEADILKAGMDVRKTPSPVPPPSQVQNLNALPSRTGGQIELNWDTLGRNYFYQVEMFLESHDGSGTWEKLAVSSKSKFTVTGLAIGTVYRFRVAGIGRNDEVGPFSQEASSVAP